MPAARPVPPVPPVPKWMPWVLYAAGAYNLAWGTWVILFPSLSFSLSGMQEPDRPLNYPQLWQCIGMIVGVYGVAYAAAGRDPVRHWPVVLAGLMGKVFGPVGLLFGVLTGQGRPDGLVTLLTNDLMWWVPFALILRRAYQASTNGGVGRHPTP